MGQTASAVCWCCLLDKHASLVRNESLKEKLLDEETEATLTVGATPSSDSQRKISEITDEQAEETNDHLIENDGNEDEPNRQSIISDGNGSDDEDTTQTRAKPGRRMSSQREEPNAWDVSAAEAENGSTRELMDANVYASDRDLASETSSRLNRILSDASVRSAKEDSYASSHEVVESEAYQDNTNDIASGRRTLQHLTSSRVFDEEASSTSSRQVAEEDGIGSYGSDASSLRSFLIRESDESLTAVVNVNAVGDDESASSPKSQSPRRGKKKSKSGKRR